MENRSEKFKFYRESVEYAKEAARKIMSEEIRNWEKLNQSIVNLAKEKKKSEFRIKILENWREFAVSGVLQFDKECGEQVLKPFTDLDGRVALGLLEKAGFDVSNLTYVKPGEYLKGAVNLDTGDQFGVVYEEPTYTLYFDHHKPGTKKVTSTTEIVYKAMVGLRLLEKSEDIDRLVDFVTKIDNRQYPPEEFMRSARTILGLQRDLDFNKLLAYFKEHQSPTEELTPEELTKYGLKEANKQQQKIIDEAMETLGKMKKEGKIVNTEYGEVVVNIDNELKVGASAAYVKYDGIINFTPDKSFAVTFKEKDIDERRLKQRLGDKFQGKIIRGKIWIYNEKEPLQLKLEEIVEAIGGKFIKSELFSEQVNRPDGSILAEHLRDKGSHYLSTSEITFKDKNGKEIKFSDLLPPGWTFISYDEESKSKLYTSKESKFSSCAKTKTITYGDLNKDGALFALLHEIGHSWLETKKEGHNSFSEIMESYTANYDNRDLTEEDIRNREENLDDYVRINVYDAYGKGTGGIDNDEPWFSMLVPKKIIQKYGKAWAANERRAWAYALKQIRRFRKEGLNIEPNLEKLDELQSEIYNCLASYEETFSKEYKDATLYFTKGKKFKKKDIDEYFNQK